MIDALLRDIWNDSLVRWLLIATVALSALLFYAMVQEQKEWKQFAATHNCKKVGYMSGDVLVSVVPSGNGASVATTTTTTPSKTGWQCDDGVTYWR